MKNLGRAVVFLLLMESFLCGDVKAKVDNRVAYSGEVVTYSLIMSGNDINKPLISDICGNEILATSSQTSFESINGAYSKSYTLSYEFMPKNSCVIEPVAVLIDGKIEHSNRVELVVKAPSQGTNEPFVVTLEAPTESLYVGEPFEVRLIIKQSLRAQALDSKFVPPEFQGFWLKSQSEPERVDDGEFVITTMNYKLAPQREGNLTIKAAQLQIASRSANQNSWGSFSPQVKWRAYYSNEPSFLVKPLPANVSYVGDFTIVTELQKEEIYPNEALSVKIIVTGEGNLEDIQSFKPYVANVNIFDEKINIEENRLTQKLAFVADENFTIPAFELTFFNIKRDLVEKIQTEPINITVVGGEAKNSLEVKGDEGDLDLVASKKESRHKSESQDSFAIFFIGMFSGVLLSFLFLFLKPQLLKKENKKRDSLKDEKLLLIKLLPYREDADVQNMVDFLESNVYAKEKKPLNKKLIKELLKRYAIS